MSRFITPMLAIAAHDLSRELRRPVAIGATLLFGCSSLVVLRLALAGGGKPSSAVLAGALWVVLVFAALVGTSRVFAAEREDGAWDALLLAPADRAAIHLGKTIAAFVTMLVMHGLLTGLYLGLFGAPPWAFAGTGLLLATIALADAGLAAVGVLVGALSLRARGRDVLGPALFLPLSLPLVIAATTASIAAWGGSSDHAGSVLAFLAAYAATFLVAGTAAFPELAVE